MNVFPLLLYVHFLAFSHLRKSEVLCALSDFFQPFFCPEALLQAGRSLWRQSLYKNRDPDPIMNFVWFRSASSSHGQKWGENMTCWTICYLLHFFTATEKLLLKLQSRILNIIGGLGLLLSSPLSLNFSPLLSVMLCDFLKHVVFHTVPSLAVLQHEVFMFYVEIPCNQAISISKQLTQNVFL